MSEYTEQQLDEIDAMVAEHVIGYKGVKQYPGGWWVTGGAFPCAIQKYTRSGSAMLEILEKMRATFGPTGVAVYGATVGYSARIGVGAKMVFAETLPLSVALAALQAVGHQYRDRNQ